MWNPFRRTRKPSAARPPGLREAEVNRVDALANALQSQGRMAELEGELKKLDQSGLSPLELESWWHLYGIVAFQDGRDAEALQRFETAYQRFPDSGQIRFSLGQQYIRGNSADKGFELFRTCCFPAVPREFALAQARYAYLWNRHCDGLLFIRPFFAIYKQVKILDDHFLYVRGLPFFGRWWSYLAAFSVLSRDFNELESATQYVVQNCHDYDFDHLQLELRAYRDDAPEVLLSALEKRLLNLPVERFPSGYTRMSIAIIKARVATDFEAAQELLAGVCLSDSDSSWLSDIRTLALAEAAHRLRNSSVEAEQVESLLTRQPMLFEPDIALNFHLLRYQENLKPRVTMC
jgi:tetratricopeptide (TPR) repeat protein